MIIAYLIIGAVLTLIRLWIIVRFKIGSWTGYRWKALWLTIFIIENIVIWPIETVYWIGLLIWSKVNPEKYEDFICDYFDIVCEEDDD